MTATSWLRGRGLALAAVGVALLLPLAATAAPSPATVVVGVRGAGPAHAAFTGGPISGSADGSGIEPPVSCSDPTCESFQLTLKGPVNLPPRGVNLRIVVTYPPTAGASGALDLWLRRPDGTVVNSAFGKATSAEVDAAVDLGGYLLEVTGDSAAVNQSFRGTASVSVPTPTAPAGVSRGYRLGILPPAPASGLKAGNEDGEPGLGVDGNGTFWAASNIAPYAADDVRALAAVSGTDIWKSRDDGRTWSWVAAPFNNAGSASPGAGGEDTDLAVAPVRNANGYYNIYVASLWIGSTSVAVSQDGGETWSLTPVNGEPVQDRPWLAADGPCVFYLSYHALAPYDTIVDKYDVCNQSDQAVGSAVDPTDPSLLAANIAPGLTNRFGKLVVDTSPRSPHQHRVYVPMEGCRTGTTAGAPEVGTGCQGTPQEFIGYSDDGVTYHDVIVAPVATKKLFIWPSTVATDAAGNVYFAWFDDQHSYLAVSRDGGQRWSKPIQLNRGVARSSVYPTVAASRPGHVVVAFYGSTRPGDAGSAPVMGLPNSYGAANWQLFETVSSDYGRTWSQQTVTPVIHTGILCYNGGGCTASNGDRNLLDDFGVAISPRTGTAAMVFNNDQPGGTQGRTHTDYAVSRPRT